jgi:drug/metabolite transporter (DMT)-like permease
MNLLLIPIVSLAGAISEATGMIIDKKVIRKHQVNYKNYTVYGFLAIVLVMIPFMFFYWEVKPPAYLSLNVLIFALVVLSSILANLLIFYSLKRETVTELEPIRLMQPLFTILLAFILSFFLSAYSNERRYSILILALIASIALIASHVKKHHLAFDKYIIAALIGSLLFAVELVVSKTILPYYSALSFYFIRCLAIFLITLLIFRPKIELKNKTKLLMLASGAVWVFYRVILYHGYLAYGVIFTTILFILGPVFIFAFAKTFLKEKINKRQIIASIIIILCIIAAIVIEI